MWFDKHFLKNMPIMTISESYIALKKEELITMKAYSKTWISLYICVSYNNCLFYVTKSVK